MGTQHFREAFQSGALVSVVNSGGTGIQQVRRIVADREGGAYRHHKVLSSSEAVSPFPANTRPDPREARPGESPGRRICAAKDEVQRAQNG